MQPRRITERGANNSRIGFRDGFWAGDGRLRRPHFWKALERIGQPQGSGDDAIDPDSSAVGIEEAFGESAIAGQIHSGRAEQGMAGFLRLARQYKTGRQ